MTTTYHPTYHTYMEKTTVYLPKELKLALEQAAARQGVSEAELIRSSIRAAVAPDRPRPTPGIIRGTEPIAEAADDLLAGFGQR